MNLYEFVPPFGGSLSPDNRWIKLAQCIDWPALEAHYAAHFSEGGKAATPFRTVFGALVIKRALNLSDRQLIDMVRENPYMQYLLGATQFEDKALFSVSGLKLFRQRVPKSAVAKAVRQFRDICRGGDGSGPERKGE